MGKMETCHSTTKKRLEGNGSFYNKKGKWETGHSTKRKIGQKETGHSTKKG
ncbi:hypothetical protein HanRHA438_Chr02g0054981 [Helianthus annuus]|nr:hypothetical protein HanIR_Chr02g0060661 [Helianthus annuus]KAJ0938904.1 hypothetical protein HanRHA438_Chr02g0054981 [Helianthus annuus]